ncbi:YggS family pyridoxal phosphate-dependent enzyme [Oxalobacteraceae bacterium CAVE-383]|nr:YggS family pyridoxal phosphate-dependent enzyme [Oxalobacteraceae bacterium CAVE-383]
MSLIASNLQAVHQQIARAASAAGRAPDGIRLLAVSKTFGADAVLEAWRAGQLAFGESYLQEALAKINIIDTAIALARKKAPPEWHFIGPIQSNKTRPIAENFSWVHSVEREKIARRLSEQRPAHLPPLNLCLQVNISGEDSKSGAAPEEAEAIAREIAALPNIRLRGLMAIPAPTDDPLQQRAAYRPLRELFERLNAQGMALDTLSMGMSADLAAAVAEGSTMLRIGSAIFGGRT